MIGSTRITCGDPKSKPASALPFFLATGALEFTILTANGRRRVSASEYSRVSVTSGGGPTSPAPMHDCDGPHDGGREHRVRLSAPAVAIVKTVIEIRRRRLHVPRQGRAPNIR